MWFLDISIDFMSSMCIILPDLYWLLWFLCMSANPWLQPSAMRRNLLDSFGMSADKERNSSILQKCRRNRVSFRRRRCNWCCLTLSELCRRKLWLCMIPGCRAMGKVQPSAPAENYGRETTNAEKYSFLIDHLPREKNCWHAWEWTSVCTSVSSRDSCVSAPFFRFYFMKFEKGF